jgi:hypothetical protein
MIGAGKGVAVSYRGIRGRMDFSLRFEAAEPGIQGLKSCGENGDLGLEMGEALCCGRVRFSVGGGGRGYRGLVGRASEEMGVTGLAGARLPWEDGGEWAGGLAACSAADFVGCAGG